jgi:hypothetical protein
MYSDLCLLRKSLTPLTIFSMTLLLPSPVLASDFYVALNGNDASDGSIGRPWHSIKVSIRKLRAGDTLFIREGKYYEYQIDSFPLNEATQERRIIVKNYAAEKVIVSGDIILNAESDWEQVAQTKIYRHRPKYNSNYDNLSQDGIPMRLMNKDGDITSLNGEGQWVRDTDDNSIWFIAKGGDNPSLSLVALSNAHNIFSLQEGANFITIEGLTVENAYYPVQVYSDNVNLTNLIIRNSYGDGIKVEGWHGVGQNWNSENGVIFGCDIYNFGESAIDVTGGDNWKIINNKIHKAVPTRGDEGVLNGYKSNGLMAKNESINLVVQGNTFYDFFAVFGAIILGGNT